MMADWASRWRKETSHPKKRSFRAATSATGYARQLGKDRSFSSSEFRPLHPRQSDLSKSHFSLSPKLDLFLLLPPLSQFYFLSRSLFLVFPFWGGNGESSPPRNPPFPPTSDCRPPLSLLRPIAFKLGGGRGGDFSLGLHRCNGFPPQKRQRSKEEKKWREDQSRNLFLLFFPLLLKMAWLTRLFRESTHDVKACSPLRLYVGLRGKKDLLFFTRHLFSFPCFFFLRLPEMHQSGGGKEERPVNIFRHFPLLLSLLSLSYSPSPHFEKKVLEEPKSIYHLEKVFENFIISQTEKNMPTNSSGKRSSKHPRSRLCVLLFLSKGIYFLLPIFSLAPKSFALFLLPDSIRRRAEGEKSSSFFFLSSPSNKSIPQSSSSAGGEKERRRRRRRNKTTEKMGWKGERRKEENKRNAFPPL